jgi:ribosome-associated heat shock protein Hsp15
VDAVRIDRWLCAARLFKSRTQAADACRAGHVRLNGRPVRPHHAVGIGDEVRVERAPAPRIVDVRGLAERRLAPPAARDLYDDRSPPPPPREPRVAVRARGTGRPTKRQRRHLQRARGRP